MAGEAGLRCQLVQPGPVAIIELHGHLRLETASRLRLAVEKALAESIEAIVLDVAGLREVDDLCVSIFPTLGRLARRRDVPLVLAAPSPSLRRALRVAPLFVHVVNGRSDVENDPGAFRRARYHASLNLAADAHAPMRARRFTASMCANRHRDDLTNDAVLVANELVSNAVLHVGHGEIVLVLRFRRRHLRVEVHDQEPALLGTSRGHGLDMVAAICAQWGWRPTLDGRGKIVWANLPIGRHRSDQGTASRR